MEKTILFDLEHWLHILWMIYTLGGTEPHKRQKNAYIASYAAIGFTQSMPTRYYFTDYVRGSQHFYASFPF